MDETMAIAVITAGTGFFGALVGGVATLMGTRWAAREERVTRRREALHGFRSDLAKRHEEREVAEYGDYKTFLDTLRRFEVTVLLVVRKGLHTDPAAVGPLPAFHPPSLVFAPPAIAAELEATLAGWQSMFGRLTAEVEATRGAQPALAKKYEKEMETQRERFRATLKNWAVRLRSGAAALEHDVLTTGAPPAE